MNTKLLFLVALLAVSINAQSQATNQTENYDPDGTYYGDGVENISLDFTKWSASDLTMSQTLISEKEQTCFYKWKIEPSRTFPTAAGWVPSVCLHNNNPWQSSGDANASSANPPTIYFPKFNNGAGAIRIVGYTSDATDRSILLSYWNTEKNYWTYIKPIGLPNRNIPDGVVESGIDIPTAVSLKLVWNQSSWPAIKSIQISKFGEGLPTSTDIAQTSSVKLINNLLSLGNTKADIQFFNFTGQIIFSQQDVSGNVILPQGAGIVKVIQNKSTTTLKKIK